VPPAERACVRCSRVSLGYVRGIGQQLDAIEAADPGMPPSWRGCAAWPASYRFDAHDRPV
jgi:hypothetical protein